MSRQSEANSEPNTPDSAPELPLVRLGSRAYLALAPEVDESAVRAVRRLAAWSHRPAVQPRTEEQQPPQSGGASSLGSH